MCDLFCTVDVGSENLFVKCGNVDKYRKAIVMTDSIWFWPDLSRIDAEKIVDNGEPGCFLLRSSTQLNCIALTYKCKILG